MTTAAIIGGGIGGLSAAVALRRAGVEADVYEQAPELKEIGAGLAVWANGVKALHHLGLADQLAATASVVHVTGTRTAANPKVDLIDLRPVHERILATSVAMHRGELLQILLKGCDLERVHPNKQARHVEQTPDRVTVHFSDGTVTSADILVASDGVSSSLRKLLTGASLTYAGYSTYRSTLTGFDPGSEWPRHAIIRVLGCGEYFGLGELAGGRHFWFFNKNGPVHDSEPEGRKATVRDLVRSWAPPIASVVEATPQEQILCHPVYRLRPLKTWRFGRVVLLGDAAHPIEPALGVGASLAIEDAVILGRCLGENPNHDRALHRYERLRMSRVLKLRRWAGVLARSEQMSNPLMCRMRDLSTPVVPQNATRFLARSVFDFTPD